MKEREKERGRCPFGQRERLEPHECDSNETSETCTEGEDVGGRGRSSEFLLTTHLHNVTQESASTFLSSSLPQISLTTQDWRVGETECVRLSRFERDVVGQDLLRARSAEGRGRER